MNLIKSMCGLALLYVIIQGTIYALLSLMAG